MELVLSVIIFVATAVVVAAAPTISDVQVPVNTLLADQEMQRDYYRDKRSQYQYMSPCAAAAASSPIPAIAPATYQVNLSPYPAYAAPAHHGYYGMPHYRSVEFEPEQEMLDFSDMVRMTSEQMPTARYGYVAPAPAHVSAGYAGPAATSNVFGVFPNVNAGGCNVPLLFSCAPSVVQGRIAPGPAHYSPGDSYRGVESMSHHEVQEHHQEPVVQEKTSPAQDPSHTNVHQ